MLKYDLGKYEIYILNARFDNFIIINIWNLHLTRQVLSNVLHKIESEMHLGLALIMGEGLADLTI